MPFSVTGWDNEHFQNTERFAKLVRNLYLAAIREATRLGLSVDHDPNKPFRFSDFPSLNKRAQQLFDDLAANIQTVIHNGVDSEWDFANDKNDELLKSVFKTDKKLPERALARYTGRNQEALAAFKERKANGLDLSDRIWNPVKQFRSELEMALELGIADGKSADQISRDIRSYLENPDMLFRRIRKRKDGPLRLSQHAKAYNPGRGVSRSSYKNAQRLARTEINMAYRDADFNRWQNFDFVVGIEVRRSNNPYGCDVCESLKGRYPKNFKFRSWHPNCRCHAISILATDDEINELELRLLNDEDLSDFRSVNEVTEMPNGWDKWIKTNEDRLLRAKSQPYFIRDNFKDGDPSKGLRFTLAAPIKSNSPTIDLSRHIKGDLPTNKEMGAILNEYAMQFPENFRNGLGNVSFRSSKSYMMQHSMGYHPLTKKWVGQSSISVSTNTFVGNFNPAAELAGAFGAIKNGKTLTFNQEYAMESMWHEILHAKTLAPPRQLTSYQVEKMETVNQFVARHTYNDFIEAFGGRASNKQDILENGLGYKTWVKNFRTKLKDLGIPEQKAVRDLMPILMDDYEKIANRLEKYLQANATQ